MRQDDFHPRQAPPRPDIVEIAGRRLHVNHDIVGSRLGYRRVAILQNLATAVLLENNRLHAKSLPWPHSPKREWDELNERKLYVAATFNNSLLFSPAARHPPMVDVGGRISYITGNGLPRSVAVPAPAAASRQSVLVTAGGRPAHTCRRRFVPLAASVL